MCLSCGCKQPNEAHGDERNITMQDLEAAAKASEIGADQVVKNIQQGYQEFGSGQFAGAGAGNRQTGGDQQS